jgi:hypothetical protein
MVRPAKTSCIIGSFFLLAVISAIFFTVRPQTAHGARDSCPLSPTQKVRAVKAFKGLAPIFQEPRCLNCHGAVNPFSRDGGHGGGYINIREEAKKFLQLPDFQSTLTTGSDPTGSITAKTIAGLKEMAESPTEISDNDLIRRKGFDPMRKACKECHIFSWIIPMRHNHFAGRSAKQMCVHMKTSSLTNRPDLFLRHMQDDELVLEGFKGRKGLLEAGGAEPPHMSFATLVKYANDWIDAMGGKFHDPPDCGCTAEGIVLEFKSHIVQEALNLPSPPYGMFMSSNGFDAHVEATVPLQHTDDRGWVGEGMMQYNTRTLTQPAACEIRTQGTGTTTFHVNGGSISSDPEPFAVNLIILPGQSGEVAETHCVGSNDQKLKELMAKANPGVPLANEARVVSKGGGWSGAFNVTRFTRFNRAKGGYEIGGWTPGQDSDVIAKKTIRVNCSLGLQTCREVTELTIKQAPSLDTGP